MSQDGPALRTSLAAPLRHMLTVGAVVLASGLALDSAQVPIGSIVVTVGLAMLVALPVMIVIDLFARAIRAGDWRSAIATATVMALMLLSALWKSG